MVGKKNEAGEYAVRNDFSSLGGDRR